MGFKDLVRTGVALASRLTGDFQATVSHKAAKATRNADGTVQLNAATVRAAVVSSANEIVTTAGGLQVVARTRITFLGAVAVGLEDEITLPDGRVPAIRRVDPGLLDDDGTGFVTVVYCD